MDLAVVALVIAGLSFVVSAWNAWTNWRNRADKHSVWLSLDVNTELHTVLVDGRPVERWQSRWVLHNAGEGTISPPDVRLSLRDGSTFWLSCGEPLLGKSSIELSPFIPTQKGLQAEPVKDFMGATATATWRSYKNRPSTAPVSVIASHPRRARA